MFRIRVGVNLRMLVLFVCCAKSACGMATASGLTSTIREDGTDTPPASLQRELIQRDEISQVSSREPSSNEPNEQIDQPNKQRFRVVRHSNGTLGLIILDSSSENQSNEQNDPNNSGAGKHPTHYSELQQPSGTDDYNIGIQQGASRLPRAADTFVFPTEATDIRTDNDQKHTFYESVSDYPLQTIESSIASNLDRYGAFFDKEPRTTLGNRFGGESDDLEEQPMCDGVSKLIWPQKGLTKDNSWEFIVNSDRFQQTVRIVECTNADAACTHANSFSQNLETHCRQMYTYHRLLATKDNVSEPVINLFKFPSCCQCTVKSRQSRG